MQGKTVLITGANAGMGYETAKELARRGATVVMLCRSRDKGEAARRAIVEETKNQAVELLVCDLSLMADVRRAAADFKARHQHLHVLVNNAGVFLKNREVTSEGIEKTFATNYLSHFLLTNLLLDTLKASAPARIVNVATKTTGLKMDFDDVMLEKGYSLVAGMGRTKLSLIMFTTELAKRTAGTGVTVNALHPGLVATTILDDGGLFLKLLMKLMATPAKGARLHVHLATSPDVAGVSGKLFAGMKPVELGGQARDPANGARLWDLSAQLVSLDAAQRAA